ncbi:nuclease-related domain-containing DEAD/DEAH box helicase [cf. Phormidesmis sp. LEGE 11477]|uniref:nuclease-related domain-containing DEAD/DEAH box helicase n=1 Tax=cf. Phormidesmis sp. LEGE 11477 TaxID=1828680 RepID=UPI00187EB20A|nr:nuclease-related domain-containing DEAD/DEAH box helicase [cf. Phormidesmis sp. LEGE 11477]MBE9060536.1 NERD domain-containing protein [cf. Phormidesmis sp. LEGE 11477]
MAYTIPDSIPPIATQGEKTLFSILRNGLPDDYIVWYEPRINHQYPDFLILGPAFGLLIIEVKGWFGNQIDSADRNQFLIRRRKNNQEHVSSEESPLGQAHRYFCHVSDKLKEYSILRHLEGPHQGKLVFPIGKGAVMSNITVAQAQKLGLDKVLEQPAVAYRDELLVWQNLNDRELIHRLKEMFAVKFPFYALTDEQVSTVKGILHPEIQIRTEPATSRSLPPEVKAKPPADSKIIVSLDPAQETAARRLGEGHRLISGVAGSGKTLILIARAKFLANESSEHRILILCYHKSLAAYLRSLIHSPDYPNYEQQIEILHFNDWARNILGVLPSPQDYPNKQTLRQTTGEQLVEALQENPDLKWDAILVDESHTFAPEWFRCCVTALKDGEDGKLLIVSDGNQKIHQRKNFTWKSVGIKAQGRTKILKLNYRNTQEIVEAAWAAINLGQFAMTDQWTEETTFPLISPKSVRKQGSVPVLHPVDDLKQSVRIVHQQIEDFIQAGYLTQDIAIIFHSHAGGKKSWLSPLEKLLEAAKIEVYRLSDDRSKRHYSVNIPGVRFVSAESSLGLEFKAVVIMEVERFVDNHEDEAMRYRKLYVAMTRAQDRLHILGSASHPFLKKLEATKKFVLG